MTFGGEPVLTSIRIESSYFGVKLTPGDLVIFYEIMLSRRYLSKR